jgi:phenylpropionate dioxygenase-like ring-hydroxylating dioxygenase large terminal subunit
MTETMPAALTKYSWPKEGVSRVPYWVYLDQHIYEMEQEKIFRGSAWNYAGLDAELPNPGDFKTTAIGDTPVIVTRASAAALTAMPPISPVSIINGITT